MQTVLGNILQGQCQTMYFFVNKSPPKPLNVATSNFADVQVKALK